MNEIIKPHSFEEAKEHIKNFSVDTTNNLGLNKVDNYSGLFGLFDHKVTGDELNRITAQIQEYLIKFNNLNIGFIQEFWQVYKALESLDTEYISAILSAVKAAEIASNNAEKANVDVKKTIQAHDKIIKILEKQKEKLDRLEHLNGIDEIWNKMKLMDREIKEISNMMVETKKSSNNYFEKEKRKSIILYIIVAIIAIIMLINLVMLFMRG